MPRLSRNAQEAAHVARISHRCTGHGKYRLKLAGGEIVYGQMIACSFHNTFGKEPLPMKLSGDITIATDAGSNTYDFLDLQELEMIESSH